MVKRDALNGEAVWGLHSRSLHPGCGGILKVVANERTFELTLINLFLIIQILKP